MQELLNLVKQSLRITHNALDSEITQVIDEALLDLELTGIRADETDKLIQRAVIVYAKANVGLDNKDAERYQKSFENIKARLSLVGEYHV